MITPSKRKEIEKLIFESMSLVDKTELNTNTYKNKLQKLNDKEFDAYIKDLLSDEDKNFYMQTIPFKNQPTLRDIKDGLEYLDIPTEEYVYLPFKSIDPKNPIKTKIKVPVGNLYVKRLQQSLSKKNSYSLSISKRNEKTNQVTSDDKVARIADAETIALTVMDANEILKEYLGPRADNQDAKMKMYQEISDQGYTSGVDYESDIESSQTINTVNTYFLAAGISSDLISNNLLLPRTLKRANKKRESTSSKMERR